MAPAYAAKCSEMAKSLGLGRKKVEAKPASGANLTDESAGRTGYRRQWPDWHGSICQILSTSGRRKLKIAIPAT